MGTPVGRQLNEHWSIGARHALFHKDGTWYHQLSMFPGALCDPNGYVLFRSEKEFRDCSKLRLDQDCNVNGHISEIPGYIKVPESEWYRGR